MGGHRLAVYRYPFRQNGIFVSKGKYRACRRTSGASRCHPIEAHLAVRIVDLHNPSLEKTVAQDAANRSPQLHAEARQIHRSRIDLGCSQAAQLDDWQRGLIRDVVGRSPARYFVSAGNLQASALGCLEVYDGRIDARVEHHPKWASAIDSRGDDNRATNQLKWNLYDRLLGNWRLGKRLDTTCDEKKKLSDMICG